MSCGDNPQANMASSQYAHLLVTGQPDPAGMALSALREELAVWRCLAASGGSYDMNRTFASSVAIRREEARKRGLLFAPAAMSNTAPCASTALTTRSPMSYAISPGDNRSSWPPEPVHVPPPPAPVLDELRRALRTVRD
eukprot:5041733-Pleurochrysis_carterae.AAC.1